MIVKSILANLLTLFHFKSVGTVSFGLGANERSNKWNSCVNLFLFYFFFFRSFNSRFAIVSLWKIKSIFNMVSFWSVNHGNEIPKRECIRLRHLFFFLIQSVCVKFIQNKFPDFTCSIFQAFGLCCDFHLLLADFSIRKLFRFELLAILEHLDFTLYPKIERFAIRLTVASTLNPYAVHFMLHSVHSTHILWDPNVVHS